MEKWVQLTPNGPPSPTQLDPGIPELKPGFDYINQSKKSWLTSH